MYFYEEMFLLWAAHTESLTWKRRSKFSNSYFPSYIQLYIRSFSLMDTVLTKLNNIGSAHRYKTVRHSQNSVLRIHSCNIYGVPIMCWAQTGTKNKSDEQNRYDICLIKNAQIVNKQHPIIIGYGYEITLDKCKVTYVSRIIYQKEYKKTLLNILILCFFVLTYLKHGLHSHQLTLVHSSNKGKGKE